MIDPTDSKAQLITELKNPLADTLLVTHSIRTKPVEKALRSVPRHLFVDRYYQEGKRIEVDPQCPTPEQLKKIYSDDALVSHLEHKVPTSSTSQPALVAQMLIIEVEWFFLDSLQVLLYFADDYSAVHGHMDTGCSETHVGGD